LFNIFLNIGYLEVFTICIVQIVDSWVLIPCTKQTLVFGGACCLHYQELKWLSSFRHWGLQSHNFLSGLISFNPEDGGSMFFWNVSVSLQTYVVLKPRRLTFELQINLAEFTYSVVNCEYVSIGRNFQCFSC
jgi:hypothetical protein